MKNWKKIVSAVAPTLATALGGPLAGAAVKTLATQFLDKPDASEDEVAQAVLNASPQDYLKLRQIDAEFKQAMIDAGVKLEEIAAADRNSARDMAIKTGDVWTPRILSAAIVIGWFAIQWYLLKHVIPQEMREIVMRALGTLDMALGMALGFYFGTSASSRNKDETLAHIAKME